MVQEVTMTIGTRRVRIGLALAAAVGMGTAAVAADKAAGGAYATLNPTQGSTVKGKVEFKPAKGGVLVTAHIEGLTPGTHGFHVHEKGDCSAPDGASAGGHFNPATKPHAARDAKERHAGDLGNVEANAQGVAEVKFVDAQLKLDGPEGILGKGVIVHEKADDFTTQPTGNAGGRKACGVVQAAPAEKPE
jgi:Cu-Zn family superoxide dismutase